MKERSELISYIRGEIMGPASPMHAPEHIRFDGTIFSDPKTDRLGALTWSLADDGESHEILYYRREAPSRKYGVGLLFSDGASSGASDPAVRAAESTDHTGIDAAGSEGDDPDEEGVDPSAAGADSADHDDEFEIANRDNRRPSTMGISFCVRLKDASRVTIRFPQRRRFFWCPDEKGVQLNGWYEKCVRRRLDREGVQHDDDAWRRRPVASHDTVVAFHAYELAHGKRAERKYVPVLEGCGLKLAFDVYPRLLDRKEGIWLMTVVIRNLTTGNDPSSTLYQAFFEVAVEEGSLHPYPESARAFDKMDLDEQSMVLLYRDAATWGIGHGCAAGWEDVASGVPRSIYADVMPAVELPSMTPDIEIDGVSVKFSMDALSCLSDDPTGDGWHSLHQLAGGYSSWIDLRRTEIPSRGPNLASVAKRHLDECGETLSRIEAGLELLRTDLLIRESFRLANRAMLLQQAATKRLSRREARYNKSTKRVEMSRPHVSPLSVLESGLGDDATIGNWRAFQLAFILMSLPGVSGYSSADREKVDLIWFPTGGGKTEAYLGVAAFYMFLQRLRGPGANGRRRDGTNVLMRYTLRMLTTQQFQRAASLVCAMEYLRERNRDRWPAAAAARFSLGLWIGGDGSPNKVKEAKTQLARYRNGDEDGNPLVLTECPWCRAEIGRLPEGKRLVGIVVDEEEGPYLRCSDHACHFGAEHASIPVEVIDERIYRRPPSMVIGTADKFAMLAYRPAAGSLFGRDVGGEQPVQTHSPPGLIIQDELHLISGPLGTMYALYEGVIERLCTEQDGSRQSPPKIIASTATIRGAEAQVRALYGRIDEESQRTKVQLFPSPGLTMGDSFFGRYARNGSDNGLRAGRLYVGIHGSNFPSLLTAEVRAFAAALAAPFSFDVKRQDPWWTLLAFYNSIRELGGAKTLFDSDIRSRLKYLFNRDGFGETRRALKLVKELTSRLKQSEIVKMMDELAQRHDPSNGRHAVDACLASNIIEVGVDIDRMSLMAVVGQPKSTASYIQVTGRVGRAWWERPGLILMMYNPNKSRDRSHFEQFGSYHRRLYERVEPTTATPFSVAAIKRGLVGPLIAWARQQRGGDVSSHAGYRDAVESAFELLCERCAVVQKPQEQAASLDELRRVKDDLLDKWAQSPQLWEQYPPNPDSDYLIRWPGQYYSPKQRLSAVEVPTSMRQVDSSAELDITDAYAP